MLICRARLRNTSDELTLRMSGEQIRLQFPPKLFEVNSWIVQMIRQWIPDGSGDRKCTGHRNAPANSRNWQLMISGRSQMLAIRNFEDWHTVVGEVPWRSVAKTTMDCHSKLVLHSLRNNQPVQVIMHQPRETTLPVPVTRRDAAFWTFCPWPSSVRDVTNAFTDSMSSERWTRLSCRRQKKHVLQTFESRLLRPISAAIVTPRSRTKAARFYRIVTKL